MKQQIKSSLILLLTATIWGVAFVAQSMGMEYIGPFTFNAIQMCIRDRAEGKDDVVLDGETISTWLSVDDDFNVSVDDEALSAYVKAMAKNYNTAYGNRTLDTSYGQTVTIYGGNYGWWVDNAAEKEMILEDLKAGKDVTREPVYSQTANSHGENDYGNTYVEINLTAQHLFRCV